MTAGVPERPLIPQPPATVAALRRAVARLPAALPAFTREADAAADGVRQVFIASWAAHVHVQRHPHLAARFRELEDLVAASDDEAQVRGAAAELGRILDDAYAAMERGASPPALVRPV
ncbi:MULTISPECIES: hypothetical protein [Streptomyces]|uniref:Uncharacterized protein n=1 Tax=Streptomyces luteosporeus TaxID=173856 RepID=A0ABP6G558_9ACTN